MNELETGKKLLENCLQQALIEYSKDSGRSFFKQFSSNKIGWLSSIVDNAASQKAVISVIITSLVKKSINPKQDIRLHQSKMNNGYSGRTLDTNLVTPFLQTHFRMFSMKESGWLTRSLEQPVPFDMNFTGAIRNKTVRASFLQLINEVEVKGSKPIPFLVAFFILLEMKKNHIKQTTKRIPSTATNPPIRLIMDILTKHFFHRYTTHGASRLPVLAIYSIYQIMVKEHSRFKGKQLLPLKSHVTADLKSNSIGDIEVAYTDGRFFEVVEIKLNIPITYSMIDTILESKIRPNEVSRYYVLTSAVPFIDGDQKEVFKLVYLTRNEFNCELILNGLIPSINYYLRLIENTKDFLENYNNNLINDVLNSSEIKEEHVNQWIGLLKESGLDK